jgi:tetratricopeptide (TPR) repeat protein
MMQRIGRRVMAKRPPTSRPDLDDLRRYLYEQGIDSLVELLIEQAADDPRLFDRLALQWTSTQHHVDLRAMRHTIDRALGPVGGDGFVSDFEYGRGLDEVVASLGSLMKQGHAGAVLDLVEYALVTMEEGLDYVDESPSGLEEAVDALVAMHLQACRIIKPNPEVLASRLLQYRLESGHDFWQNAMETHADVLGPKGLAAYRSLAEREWERVPSLSPGEETWCEAYRHRGPITQIMEGFAREANDLEALVAVKGRNLSQGGNFLGIARLYQQNGQRDKAIAWARRGIEAFPRLPEAPLHLFLADELFAAGETIEAMAVMWAFFAQSPSLRHYQELQQRADRTGQWPSWRERALTLLRERTVASRSLAPPPRERWALAEVLDHTELVRILLWENEVDAAWQEAQQGGCSQEMWLALAEARGATHPSDAVGVYKRVVDSVLMQTGDWAYERAVALLGRIRECLLRAGMVEQFPPYVASLRETHRRKRNLLKRLDRQSWT